MARYVAISYNKNFKIDETLCTCELVCLDACMHGVQEDHAILVALN